MSGLTERDFEVMADPTVGAGSLDPLPVDSGAYCDRCFCDLAACQCRTEDATALLHLRNVVAALRALPWSSPVPATLVSVINGAEDYLRKHHPEE